MVSCAVTPLGVAVPVYDATFFADKPAATAQTYSGEHVTPCLDGCAPIVVTGLGAFGHNWLIGGVPNTMNRVKYRAFCDALPQGSTVCIDIEGDDATVAALVTYALRTGRERRPDCKWGFYAPHDGYSGHMNGDRATLGRIELTDGQRACLRLAQFVGQEGYWRFALPDDWNAYTPLDKARTALHLSWQYHACARWKQAKPGVEVYVFTTGSVHNDPELGAPLGMTQVQHAAESAAKFADGLVLWGGPKWASQDKYAGTLDYPANGKRWTKTAISAFNAVQRAA